MSVRDTLHCSNLVQVTTNKLKFLARKQQPPGIFQKIAELKNNFGNLIEKFLRVFLGID